MHASPGLNVSNAVKYALGSTLSLAGNESKDRSMPEYLKNTERGLDLSLA